MVLERHSRVRARERGIWIAGISATSWDSNWWLKSLLSRSGISNVRMYSGHTVQPVLILGRGSDTWHVTRR